MLPPKFVILTALAVVTSLLCSCTPVAVDLANYNSYNLPARRPSDRENVIVKVSLKKQLAYVLEDGKPLLVMPITVGLKVAPTPTGTFRIFKKHHKHRAYTHGFRRKGNKIARSYYNHVPRGWEFYGTPMPYWCEFKGAYGFHSGWMKDKPSSHGCLRMHKNVAPKFFGLVSIGTIVNIAETQREDKTLGRNVPRPPDATRLPGNPRHLMFDDRFFTMHKPVSYVWSHNYDQAITELNSPTSKKKLVKPRPPEVKNPAVETAQSSKIGKSEKKPAEQPFPLHNDRFKYPSQNSNLGSPYESSSLEDRDKLSQ